MKLSQVNACLEEDLRVDLKDREICLPCEVSEETVAPLSVAIKRINAHDAQIEDVLENLGYPEGSYERPPIRILLNTVGGGVYDGLMFYETILHTVTPIEITVGGLCASMGTIILCAKSNPKVKVRSYKTSSFMVHTVASAAQGQLQALEDSVKEVNRISKMLNEILIGATKITAKKLESLKKAKKDQWIPAEEALKLGLVDELI